MNEKEYFKPDTVDERIEQLSNMTNTLNTELCTPASTDKRLVETLQHIYRLEISPEDRNSLERARLRIASARTGSTQSHHASEEAIESVNQQRKRDIPMHIPSSPITRRPAYRWLNTLAAAIVIGLIVGSLLLITNMVRHAPNGSQTGSPSKEHTSVSPTRITDIQQNVYSADTHNVYKLSEKNGSVIWKRPINDTVQSNYGLWVVDGTVLLSTDGYGSTFYALTASNGTILWKKTQPSGEVVHSDIMGNTIFMLPQNNGTLFAYDARSGVEKWHYTAAAKGVSYILNEDTLYLKVANASLYALNAANGTERWHYTEAVPQKGYEFPIATKAVGDVVYDASMNYLYAFQASNGKLIWKQQASSAYQAFGNFHVQGNQLYADTDEPPTDASGHTPPPHVYAFNVRTGRQQWRLDGFLSLALPDSEVRLPSGVFLVQRSPNDDNTLAYVINATNGSIVTKMTNSCISASGLCARDVVQVSGQNLYVLYSSESGKPSLETYDLHTGSRTGKSLAIPVGPALPATVRGNIAYITPLANGGTISVVRLSDGMVLWKHTLDQASLTVRVVVAP